MENLDTINYVMRILGGVSITLVCLGVLVSALNFRHKHCRWSFLYFMVLLTLELISRPPISANFHLLSISGYCHFAFLGYYYLHYHFKLKITKVLGIITVTSIPLLINLFQSADLENFQSYDRAFYSFGIMILCMWYLYDIVSKPAEIDYYKLFIHIVILLFFSLESLLAVATNYLINESVSLVNSLWLTRAFLLQVFYISLIFSSWRTGKTH